MDADARKLLHIYVHDHMAAAAGGVQLAKRTARSEPDPEVRAELSVLAEEIETDRRALREAADALDLGSRAPLREAGAWLGEKLGRLKLNGRLVRRSPLSRVVELEGLLGAVTMKRALWETLLELREELPRLAAVDLPALLDRADTQRERLVRLHDRAVRDAFGARPPEAAAAPTSA